ncbi:2OG-Fe(II) oxygenase [Rheinheimera maricola]|uniref:2OG-Fe(II) oxygenase n=1 Tax=Rheinheimera maricola TaxID=2793282 RepID=A0ABS7XBF3_9GAMM|nr:2OG-Fe(II) oxygenase [Rheinheimera maricola]MBZ9612681.1 2OG-Fe(II) oxygenase [Rheinheimera maricola]
MWLNEQHVTDAALRTYRKALLRACPNHLVIDNLFANDKLEQVMRILQRDTDWQAQQHSYSALYVDETTWQKTRNSQRFVQRDVWQRPAFDATHPAANVAAEFLSFLRSDQFMALLSGIFNVSLTDINVAKPDINTNFFRLKATDFVNQHADDSPGREVCMLLYLNKDWQSDNGGELMFMGKDNNHITIAPLYNRCVLFNPSSEGAEHWVKALTTDNRQHCRYNVTSWYWSE